MWIKPNKNSIAYTVATEWNFCTILGWKKTLTITIRDRQITKSISNEKGVINRNF